MLSSIVASLVLSQQMTQSLRVTEAVESYRKEQPAIGMSVVVLEKGKKVYSQGFGWQDRENKIAATPLTRFRLASISKSVTSVGAMRLVEQGKLNLDEDIRTYVPEWPDKGAKITLRQLLSHTAGVRHYQAGKPSAFYNQMTTSEGVMTFANDALIHQPGEMYDYSTHAFTVVARAIETASGESFPAYMRTVTKLAGAESLVCETLPNTWPAARSRHYVKVGDQANASTKTENLSWKYGGGGFESSAVDLAQFGQAILDGKMMKSATLREMWKKQTPEGQSSYGLGWAITGNRRQHSGSQQGAATFLMINEQEKVVVCVMINTSGVPVGGLADTIMKIYGG